MITAEGYSKDSPEMAEGIVITWGKDMIESKGGLKSFLTFFNDMMQDEETRWLQKCKNAPQYDIIYVYIIVSNRLYARGYFGGYQKGETEINVPGAANSFSRREVIEWPRIVIAGPNRKMSIQKNIERLPGIQVLH